MFSTSSRYRLRRLPISVMLASAQYLACYAMRYRLLLQGVSTKLSRTERHRLLFDRPRGSAFTRVLLVTSTFVSCHPLSVIPLKKQVWLSRLARVHSPMLTNLISSSCVQLASMYLHTSRNNGYSRQKAHLINLPHSQRQRQYLHKDINRLNFPHSILLALKLLKRRIRSHQSHKWVLKRHEHHHDGEDLKTRAGHVHHETGHGELLDGGEGDFPSLFCAEDVHLFWGGRSAGRSGSNSFLSGMSI